MEFKIIDFELNGNSVILYVGKKELEDWHGDDWNDRPYECNAGEVYDEYVEGIYEYAFNHKSLVFEPEDGDFNTKWSKNDMKERLVPMFAFMSSQEVKDSQIGWCDSFARLVAVDHSHKVYMGDDFKEVVNGLEAAGAVLIYKE